MDRQEKPGDRVCVLIGGQQLNAQRPMRGVICMSKQHSHLTRGRAALLVSQDLAEWVSRDGKGSDVIRLCGRKRWVGRPSGPSNVKVMQLVD